MSNLWAHDLASSLQANRARTVLIQQMKAFFPGNGIDAFIGPPTNETSMGNVVGLPEMVIPVSFAPVSLGSPRQQPTSLGIYAAPNQDSKVWDRGLVPQLGPAPDLILTSAL